jgi:hypothetical protein
VTAAAGEVVTAVALAHGAAHCCARLAAMHAAQARTPLQLVPDVGGPEAANSLVVFANLGQTCEKNFFFAKTKIKIEPAHEKKPINNSRDEKVPCFYGSAESTFRFIKEEKQNL